MEMADTIDEVSSLHSMGTAVTIEYHLAVCRSLRRQACPLEALTAS